MQEPTAVRSAAERFRLRTQEILERYSDARIQAVEEAALREEGSEVLSNDMERVATPLADWIRPGDGLAARTVPMARVSLASMLPTLDAATRGGLPTGSVTGILGGPDSSKTGTAMTLADAAEHQGFIVIHLTNDNGREAAEIRWGQMMGFDRTKLEEGDADELARFQGAFAARGVYLPDPDACDENLEPINTLAYIEKEAKRLFPGRWVFLLVDSVQMVAPDTGRYESPRLRVIAVMKTLRKAASNPGWLAVATSQINRESFKNKKESKNTDPIAAGAESGSIEFGCDLMIYLSVTESGIRAAITKNKPGAGRKPSFGLLWDRERARTSEPDPGSFAEGALKIAMEAREQRWSRLEAIVTADEGLSTSVIQGKAKRNEAEVRDDLFAMADARPPRVRMQKRGNGYFWYLPSAQPPFAEAAS